MTRLIAIGGAALVVLQLTTAPLASAEDHQPAVDRAGVADARGVSLLVEVVEMDRETAQQLLVTHRDDSDAEALRAPPWMN